MSPNPGSGLSCGHKPQGRLDHIVGGLPEKALPGGVGRGRQSTEMHARSAPGTKASQQPWGHCWLGALGGKPRAMCREQPWPQGWNVGCVGKRSKGQISIIPRRLKVWTEFELHPRTPRSGPSLTQQFWGYSRGQATPSGETPTAIGSGGCPQAATTELNKWRAGYSQSTYSYLLPLEDNFILLVMKFYHKL